MDLSSLEIRYGTFSDVLGPAAAHGGFTFVPAEVDLAGWANGPKLVDAVSNADASVKAIVRPGEDAPWVSGRVQKLFHQRQIPEQERGEKCCMFFSFLAVIIENESALGIPFFCTDHYGESQLYFGEGQSPDTEMMQRIGHAFWSLLMQDPNDLFDFTDRMQHLGAGVTIEFGVEDSEPFMRELFD